MEQRLCEECKQPFTPSKRYSKEQQTTQRFCSGDCARLGNLILARAKMVRVKGSPCAHCGRIAYDRKRPICRYCQQSLPPDVLKQYVIEPPRKTWTKEQENYVREHYPTEGAKVVSDALGRSMKSIHLKATRMGVNLTKEATRRLVHSQARKYMRRDNPMKRPEVRSKVRQWREDHPEEAERIHRALMEGQQRLQQRKTSKLEKRLQEILDNLGVSYEPTALIKPKFIVDIRINDLIIQADGDYWHGHPRFYPLTERQLKQQQRDVAQTAYLIACGYTVIRIWESDMCEKAVVSALEKHGIPIQRVVLQDVPLPKEGTRYND
jgi:G:T-mismatch repair DNA endonuclease (very short patch repair protein)